MTKRKNNLRLPVTIFAAAIQLLCANVLADVGLPYIGSKGKHCKVNQPRTVLDGGFETDENCKTLYIHPPLYGEARITATSPTNNLGSCPIVNEIQSIQLDNILSIKQYTKQRVELSQLLRETDSSDTQKVTQINEKLKNVNMLIKTFTTAKTDQDIAVEAENQKFGAPVMITLANNWAELVEKYKNLNNHFEAVLPLPITKGIVTYEMRNELQNGTSLGLQQSPVLKVHQSLKPLPQVNSAEEHSSEEDDLLSEFDGTSKTSEFIMDGTANVGLDLSLLGICPYIGFKSSPLFNGLVTQSPVAYLSPNFTYYFPVASKAIYKVSLKPLALSKAVVEAQKQGGGLVNTLDLANVISSGDEEIFEEITTHDVDGNSNISLEEKKAVKQYLVDYIANSVMRSIGTLVETLKGQEENIIRWTETHRGSRGCGLFNMRRCGYTYQVHKSRPNWESISKKIADKLNGSYSASTSNQMTYQRAATMPFIPPEEIIKGEQLYLQRQQISTPNEGENNEI